MTAGLVAFLQARLDEREAVAVAAGVTGKDWQAVGTGVYSTAAFDDDVAPLVTAGPEIGGSDEDAARAEHIALHDPAQVLREVVAIRGLLNQYTALKTSAGTADASHRDTADMHRMAVGMAAQHLAHAYADHPDYRPEWRL
ncbi:DUF6221 family protein [Streptomyces sp. NPDC001822]|uniref:DUF6221 family protein n=1 Tax=Streptomyces sp. NPDC001822 TaxID=3364614 RepID=UPI003697485C